MQQRSSATAAPAPTDAHEHARILHLIQTNYAGLLGLARRKLNDTELAADLLNDAIVIALEHMHSGRLGESERVAGYVFRITMNLMRNYQRNMDNRQDVRSSNDVLASLRHNDDTDLDQQRIRELVRRVVESLDTDREREIVRRYYLHEEQKAGICAALGVNAHHFDKIVFRARQRLKALLESRGYSRGDFFCLLACLV